MTEQQRKRYEITANVEWKPLSTFLHASRSLREMRAEGLAGSAWAAMGALVMLAFSVEAFCNTYGEKLFPEDWYGKKGHEWKGVRSKLALIARKAGVAMDFEQQPWQDVAVLLETRNWLAHARPASVERTVVKELTDEETAGVWSGNIAILDWEQLAVPERAAQMERNVRAALAVIMEALGDSPWELEVFGTGGYTMSAVKGEG